MNAARMIGILADEKKYETPLVFVHGAWVGAWCWDEHFLPYFADKGFDVFAVQLRGHGPKSKLNPLMYPGLNDYLKDIIKGIDSLERNPILVGHSLGAFLLQHYIHKFHTRAAVMLAPIPPQGIYQLAMRFAMHYPLESGLLNMNLLVPPLTSIPSSAKDILFSKDMDEEKAREYLQKAQAESPRVFMDMAYPVETDMSDPDTKVHIIAGEEDKIVQQKEAEATAKAYHTGVLYQEGLGHFMMLDKAWEKCAELTLDCVLRSLE